MKDIPMPKRMESLRRDSKGRPVPFFVQELPDGAEPDFRIINPQTLWDCYRNDLCWVCGQKLGVYKCFIIGPMCAINRINSEPPSHLECARFSVQICPFLSTPRMTRRETDLPEVKEPAGIGLKHNPGAAAIWVTRSYEHFRDGLGGFLFNLGPPERVEWFCEGRPASRKEVLEAIERGLPTLRKLAEEDGEKAQRHLDASYNELMKLLPVEITPLV